MPKPRHPFVEKYNPENYQPEVYDFLADFSDAEIYKIIETKDERGIEEALALTSRTVKNKYSFKKRTIGASALDKETINHSKQVDCYGYSIATSQILGTAGIDHKIAFANTHSFVIASNNDKFYVVDSLLPQITGELLPENICHKECLSQDIFSINMLNHARSLFYIHNMNSFIRENSWIRFSKNANKFGSSDREDIRSNKNPCLVVRTFNLPQGTRALYSFDNLRVATENNNLSTGYYMSKILAKNYPEIDIRNRPITAELLIRKLGSLGLKTMSINVIDSIAEGINQTNTISPTVWKAEQYNQIGINLDRTLSHTAINILEDLLENHSLSIFQKQLLEGKIIKFKKTLS
jgi:hypothetical protein